MATMTDNCAVLSIETENYKKITYRFDIRGRWYSLVEVSINGLPHSTHALNESGFDITTPSNVIFLREIIEKSK
jgi:hypothetical protein